jgi:hypothetical protein
MNQLFGLVEYFGAVLCLIVAFAVVGLSALLLARSHMRFTPKELVLLTPIVGIAIVVIPMTILASYEVGIDSVSIRSLLVVVTSLALILTLVNREIDQIKDLLRSCFRETYVWLLGIVVGFAPYFSLMLTSEFPLGFGTSATWTNNDLGIYIQMATNVSQSGVADAGLITGWNAGLQASFDHPGSHALFASISGILDRQPYQLGIVLVATVIAVSFFASVAVISRFLKYEYFSWSLIGSIVILVNPPLIAAASNFFYPHLTSIGLSIGFLALIMILRETQDSLGGFFILASITAATWLISVEISVVMMSLISLFALGRSSSSNRSRFVLHLLVSHSVLFGIGLAVRYSLFKSQFDILTRMSASGVAGWRTNFVSPSMILGLVPAQFGGPYSKGVRLLDALFLMSLAVVLLIFIFKKKIQPIIGLATATLFLAVFVAVQRWGIDGYQTWKLITTFTPFFMVLLLIVIRSIKTNGTPSAWLIIPLITVGATFSWTSSIWKDPASSYLNQSLSQITQTEELRRQAGVNILIEPYFKTMAASAMSGVPSRMSSPSYPFFEGQELLYRCTLATTETIKTINNHGPIIAQRGHYLLVGTPVCD